MRIYARKEKQVGIAEEKTDLPCQGQKEKEEEFFTGGDWPVLHRLKGRIIETVVLYPMEKAVGRGFGILNIKITGSLIMYRYFWMSVIVAVFFCAGHAGAKQVNLGLGETFRQGDLTITCGQLSTDDTPLALKDCQYWDDFKKRCLFEKTTYVYNNIECVEDCQHWDSFNSTCHYQTTCVFHPTQKAFVRTICEKFDDFDNTCLKTSEIKIGY